MTRSMLVLALALGVGLLGVACEDKKPSTDTVRTDAGAADKYATADPKLEKALQGVVDAAAGDQGPPPDGIFEPGIADQRHPKGAPTKVDLVSDGSAPQVSLAAAGDAKPDAVRATAYGPAALEVGGVINQRIARPTVDFGLILGPAKADDGGPDWLVGTVGRVTPAKEQLGQLPPGMDKEIASLNGTMLRVKLTPDGRESDLQLQLGKNTKPELQELAQNAAEALVFATVPAPPKPVGVGAQWIAETRMPLAGADVIAYRAYRVQSIDGDRVHLTIDVKAYAASKDVALAFVPKGGTLEQFDGMAKGELELVRGESVARKADLQQQIVFIFAGPGGAQPPQQPGGPPGNMMPVQVQSQATLVRGDDLRTALKQH